MYTLLLIRVRLCPLYAEELNSYFPSKEEYFKFILIAHKEDDGTITKILISELYACLTVADAQIALGEKFLLVNVPY